MLLDALTTISSSQDLTGAAAATPSTNTLDLSVQRDLGPSNEPVLVCFQIPPTSGTGGTTINIALQTSPDNVTWTTVEETSPVPISNFTANMTFGFRGTVPTGIQRYLRMLYTPSAALTAGTVTACIGADWPAHVYYARNYVA